MADFTLDEESSFSPASIIVGSFLAMIALFLVYMYFANKSLIDQGLHYTKKPGKKSKKGKEVWSYGD